MIKHILKLIYNQRSANIWIWVEMVVVSAVLWFAIDVLYCYTVTYFTPIGHDISQTYQIIMREYPSNMFAEGQAPTQQQRANNSYKIVERIKANADVDALAISVASMPYSWANYKSTIYVDSITSSDGRTLCVNPDFFRVFRCTNTSGDTESMVNAIKKPGAMITSESMAQTLFNSTSAVGQTVYMNNGEIQNYKIIDEIPYFRHTDFTIATPFYFTLLNENVIAGRKGLSGVELVVRIKAGAEDGFEQRFYDSMKDMLSLSPYYLLSVESVSKQAATFNAKPSSEIKSNVTLLLFLVVNIFLGIVGTFWYKTEQRRAEMGLRIAIGSTPNKLRKIMIGEGLILLLTASFVAMIISINIALAQFVPTELLPFTLMRFVICQMITILIMAIMVVIGIAIPAQITLKIEPAVALKEQD